MTDIDSRPHRDGRHLRSARTRERIIAAARTIMRRGIWQPQVIAVARVAGVSTRSIFQHFDDMRSVYAEALKDDAIAGAIARQVVPDVELAVPAEVQATFYGRIAHAAVCGRPMPGV